MGIIERRYVATRKFQEQAFNILRKLYSQDGGQPNVLQQVTVRIKSNAECKKNYGTDAPGGIANHMLCAGTAGKDACSVSLIKISVRPTRRSMFTTNCEIALFPG